MDADRFDALSRALTTQGSRRATLRALVGTLLSGMLPAASPETLADRRNRNGNKSGKKNGRAKTDRSKDTGKARRAGPAKDPQTPQDQHRMAEQSLDPTEEVSAAETREFAGDEVTAASHGCRRAGSACTKDGQCCAKKCLSGGKCSCNADNPCPTPANPCKKTVCSSGRCVNRKRANGADCGDGKACCGKSCVDSQTDPTHCGICGNDCLSGEICTDGKCLCESGKEVCGASCVSSCCNQGVEEDCVGSQICCSGHGCRDLQTDKDHCGKCGASCVPDTFTDCVLGECKCGNDPACTGGKICDLDKGGCVCPNGETSCEGTCEGDKVWCGDQCLVCPPPPPGKILPGDPAVGTCCPEISECSCGGGCCAAKEDCFQTFDRTTNEVVDEFCCTDSGGVVCGNECCQGPNCESGCFRMNPVGGSYRRPGR